MTGEWILRSAHAGDLPAMRRLIEACGLSSHGVEDQVGDAYVVAEMEGKLVGVAGVEVHGTRGLLRSLAVAPDARGDGLGTSLLRDRVAWADYRRLESVHLLTTSASGYFARHGFMTADRAKAPAEIRATKEFKEVCPASAVLMVFAKGGVR